MNLISELLRGKWLISREEAHNHLPLILSVLERDNFARELEQYSDRQQHEIYAVGPGTITVNEFTNLDKATKGSVAVIPIKGVMTKYDQISGMEGADNMAANLKRIEQSSQIIGSIIELDTPGGSVGGTENLAQAIRASTKPVIAFVNENAKSAGLWVYSQADYTIAAGKNSQVGSLGVMTTIRDISGALEQRGIKEINVRSSESTEKNESILQLLNGYPEKWRKEELDPLRNNFVEAVRQGMGSKLTSNTPETFWQGATFYAEDALSFGAIDQIANFETAVAKVRELAGASSTKSFRI